MFIDEPNFITNALKVCQVPLFQAKVLCIFINFYKHLPFSSSDGPQMVAGKALCNVSTTAHHNPDFVLSELTKALMCKGKLILEQCTIDIRHDQ